VSKDQMIVEVGSKRFIVLHTNDDLEAGCDGICDDNEIAGAITIRKTLRGREYAETVLHEVLHALLPMASEEFVSESGKQLSQVIYTPEFLRRAGLD